MDYYQLLNFLGVCEEKNITKAAARRFITPQGLSKSLKDLEDELCVTLFLRTKKGMESTEIGGILELAARSYISQHEYMLELAQQYKEGQRFYLSIGIWEGASYVLPPHFLGDFVFNHSDINVSIVNFPDAKCDEFMLEHNLNIGFTINPFDAILFDSLYCRRFRIIPICGEKHRLAKKRKIKIDELKNERTIIFRNTQLLIDLYAQHGIKPDIILNSPDESMLDELLGTGQIIAWGVEFRAVKNPGWVAMELEDVDLTVDGNIIVRKNSFPNEAEERFIKYTKSRLLESDP
jgi:DNA-binding transcriptional LysR family regulator